MRLEILFTAVFIVLLFGCKKDPFKTTCYKASRERLGRKTEIFISVSTDGNIAHGEQSTVVSDENGTVLTSATGTYKGTCLNGVCFVDYQYETDGGPKLAEEEFKIQGDTLRMTAGSYRLEDGKEYMKERGLFNLVLEKINCP